MKVGILAGGYGTRLAEETEIKPKPMVEIGGKPILWHIMQHYAHYGMNEFVIALGYKGEAGSGVCRITAINSSTEAEIEILDDFKNTFATSDWLPGAWSKISGYPSGVTLFDGRLWWGGNDRIWGSLSKLC